MESSLLEQELKRVLKCDVRFDDGTRALYATDASNYRQAPIGVVLPRTEEDIIRTVEVCRKNQVPILSRGGGTSLAGQCCNVAVVMDMSMYYNHVTSIDAGQKRVTVEPGIVLDEMKKALQQDELTFGPDPATHDHCTIGGMLGNNSCGVHSVMSANYGYGARMSDNADSLTVLTYDGLKLDVGPTSDADIEQIIAAGGRRGTIYEKLRELRDRYQDLIRARFPDIPRRVSGYNLDELLPEKGFNVARALIGTESTCVVILSATLKLMPAPKARSLLVIGYPSVYDAGIHIPLILKAKPIGLEGLDDVLLNLMRKKNLHQRDTLLLPEGKGWLMAEFGGDSKQDTDHQARELMNGLKKADNAPTMKLFDDPKQEKMLWEVRESGLGATAFVPGEPMGWPGWEDAAVPPERVGDYLKEFRSLLQKFGYKAALYGHFGQGCVHCRISFDLFTQSGLEHYREFTIEAADLVHRYGGSISGEHGDGQSRGDLLVRMYGPELIDAFREFKRIWDPEGKMNPGKIVDSYGQLAHLRLGTDYRPLDSETHFKFPDDKGSFAYATLHCVGVGKCRRHGGGTMCPSYMVTRDEMHSTRGRAHLLFEMFNGSVITDRWRDKHVKEALDLCLSCKGCKGDCPVNVDIATYKSEFLSHYYRYRLRPPSAYAFGLIYWWARAASIAPQVANFLSHAPVTSSILKAMAQIAPDRELPNFAQETFTHWYKTHRTPHTGTRRVILWADTFNNHFLPETLKAGIAVLEAFGCDVIIPPQPLCCGRPLFDFGMITTAERLLRDVLAALRDEIRAGTPLVGLEPSCVAVFRDELCNLFPNDHDAARLKQQTYTLAEYLEEVVGNLNIPPLRRKALLHGHCHHKSIMKLDADIELLKRLGIECEIPESGCCGMAGYFGYKKGAPYEVSIKAGERVLLPAVRKTPEDTLIIADGFSCREQIKQETRRTAMHLAEVLLLALKQSGSV